MLFLDQVVIFHDNSNLFSDAQTQIQAIVTGT